MKIDEIIAIRRDIHQHPELRFDCHRTAGIVTRELDKLGLTLRTGVAESGVIADLEVPGASSRILLRADMDALPMDEDSDLPFRSQVAGRAHMCGHDVHTSTLIAAAQLICAAKDKLKHHVRFVFQPCEEHPPGGAIRMVEEGVLDGVDEAYALHVWPWMDCGKLGFSRQHAMAQADAFTLHIKGSGGHAAAPQQCIDPVLVAAHITTALQSIVSRNVHPLDSAVLSVTMIQAGSAFNVIPETASITGTVRTFNPELQAMMRTRIQELATQIAKGFGAQAHMDYQEGYPPVINHDAACERVLRAAGSVPIEDNLPPMLGGEDFSYFCQDLPGCFIRLGCGNEQLGASYGLHHPKFRVDEDCIAIGAGFLARIVQTD